MHSNLYSDADSFDRPCCNLPQGDRPAFDPAILAHLMGEQPRLRLILIGYLAGICLSFPSFSCGFDSRYPLQKEKRRRLKFLGPFSV